MNDETQTGDFAGAVTAIFGETFADVMGLSPRPSLRNIITTAKTETGHGLGELTVLAAQRDPYRLDTAANHALGAWLRNALAEVGHNPVATRIHARGIHYLLVGRVAKPDGSLYVNDAKTWEWLSEKVIKAARFLGYLPWTATRDARNTTPVSYAPVFAAPQWRLSAGEVELYLPEHLEPRLQIVGDLYRQPWRQVVISEKQGVVDLLTPVCKRRQAVLATPSGEVSDQMVYDLMAEAYAEDRPIVFHQIGDFDPSGNQMAVSTARTVQALCDSEFPGLEARVHAVALNKEHCVDWSLPESVIKDSEKRAGAWKAAMQWEQTEIDAAVSLAPDAFAKVVENSLLQYFDKSLANRAAETKRALEAAANERLADTLGEERLAEIRTAAEAKLEDLESLVDEVNAALAFDPAEAGVEIPPEPEVLIGATACRNDPLLDTAGDWVEQTRRLIARKKY